jgi:hypothetical protein
VRLGDLNGDGIPDLFWTMHYEEIIAGMVLFGTRDGAHPVFVTDEQTCRVPELRDLNGDGKTDVVAYEVGALTLDECQGDVEAAPCQRMYATEWAVAWMQIADSFVNDPRRAKSFYANAAREYAMSARRIRGQSGNYDDGLRPSRCGLSMADRLDSLAARADSLAGKF